MVILFSFWVIYTSRTHIAEQLRMFGQRNGPLYTLISYGFKKLKHHKSSVEYLVHLRIWIPMNNKEINSDMITEKIKHRHSNYRWKLTSVCMWVMLKRKLLSTAIDKILELTHPWSKWSVPLGYWVVFICLDRYEKYGKLTGEKTRFWNRQFSS